MKAVKILFVLAAILINAKFSNSQIIREWARIYSAASGTYDYGSIVKVDNLGNAYVGGRRSSSTGSGQFMVIKYNPQGFEQWVCITEEGGFPGNGVRDMVIDNSGNVYITGSIRVGLVDYDFIVIKYNTDGDQQWTAIYDGGINKFDEAKSIAIDNSGNVYVTGDCEGHGDDFDHATVKYNSVGAIQWSHKYSRSENSVDFASSVKVDNSGSVYAAGISSGSLDYYDCVTIKYNQHGVLQYARIYNRTGMSRNAYNEMAVDNLGNAFVTFANSFEDTGTDYVTIKYNSSGMQEWLQRYSGPANGNNFPVAIEIGLGGVIVTGQIQTESGLTKIGTVKYSKEGIYQWGINRESANSAFPASMTTDQHGDIFVTGYSRYTTNWEFITVNYNTGGEERWAEFYHHHANNRSAASSVAVDNSGNVYVTGYNSSPIYTERDCMTIKYSYQVYSVDMNVLFEASYDPSTNFLNPDTARVYIRKAFSPFSIIDSSLAVLDSEGKGRFIFTRVVNENPYYLVVKHRNSIETWSASGLSFSANKMIYDFTDAKSKAFGNNMVLKGSKYCIFSGDVDNDGSVNLTDVIEINNDASKFASGYLQTDLTGDNSVNLKDVLIAHNNSSNFVSKKIPNSMASSSMGDSELENKLSSGNKSKSSLSKNYPNPFNPVTVIGYSLNENRFVTLKIYDAVGREVASLVNEMKNAGRYDVTWDASQFASGTYYYRLQAGDFVETKRMQLIK